jgi:1-acyl-sn-glycerol-3-phosphate acyltransferase
MIYVRVLLIALWMLFCCLVGLMGCLVLWGNDNLDHYFARLYAWGANLFGRIRVDVQGVEHLEAHQPCLYVANHQSAMDMATFGHVYPQRTVVVGKKELYYIPLFGLFFKAAGNITINRSKRVSALASLADAVEQIKARKVSVWIFPEGTRNRSDQPMLPFKKGAFYMAVQAGVPIVPVLCSSLTGLVSWKERSFRGGTVQVQILPPISTKGLTEQDVDRLLAQTRDLMIAGLAQMRSTPAVEG